MNDESSNIHRMYILNKNYLYTAYLNQYLTRLTCHILEINDIYERWFKKRNTNILGPGAKSLKF